MEDISEKDVQPLYEAGDQKISKRDFVAALNEAGVEEGDVLFVHSDITSFGSLATKNKSFLLDSIIDAFKTVAGNTGTIIMPTFSYSTEKNEAFNVEHTKSTVGTLTEYFRKLNGVVRTPHPTHSAAN